MFQAVEHLLRRADAGSMLWPYEIANASSLMVNTVYFLELTGAQGARAASAIEAILAYANSRSVCELHALRHRDEGLRSAAYDALGALRHVSETASMSAGAASLWLKAA